ncbi:MucR family transcriptional regulator [Thiohalorhabdus denitrificans]|uniref:Transcriptional regulator, MucR family n=1 Tax=Thiohalorhabdus denitrificans TaxID=381306 RepID=A0A1G5F9L3_9GAMM|nr:MucR family transcriptional regulator [Thiohalorhabdus denitrificans]SCY35952.1 transcriptional regulator, MucR family [Thiohalorhabdus denitrificans]
MGTRELAAQIAANYAANAESAQEVLQLLQDSYSTLTKMEGEGPAPATEGEAEETQEGGGEKREPIMSPQKAIGKDKLTCLVCGKQFKTLKRHLNNAHGMTPQQYRDAFGLDRDYPLVAPNLSEQRAKVAKERGLGERLAEARRKQREGKS